MMLLGVLVFSRPLFRCNGGFRGSVYLEDACLPVATDACWCSRRGVLSSEELRFDVVVYGPFKVALSDSLSSAPPYSASSPDSHDFQPVVWSLGLALVFSCG